MTVTANAAAGPDVAIVMHDLRGGGAERVTLRLAQAMADAGRKVEIWLFQDRNDYKDQTPADIPVVIIGARRVLTGAPPLANLIRDRRPRTILSVMTHVNLVTLAAARMAGYGGKVMVVEHNQMSQKIANARRLAAKAAYRLAPLGYRFADIVACVSQGMADDLQALTGLPAGKIQVLYNPVVDEGLAARAAEPVDHSWFNDGGPPVLIGVGRMHPQKDFETLLRAFAIARQDRPLRLLILGEGDERSKLEALAVELGLGDADLAMPGFVSNPYAYLAKSAAFVLSSRWEGLPTVVIEALASGAPVVATDCPSGPDEILESGRLGELSPMRDPAALAAAILRELGAPKPLAERLARAQAFGVERSTARYLDALGV